MRDSMTLGWVSCSFFKKWPFVKITWEPNTEDGSLYNFLTVPDGWISTSTGRTFPFLRFRWIPNPNFDKKVFGIH